jgi:hypothetical protein
VKSKQNIYDILNEYLEVGSDSINLLEESIDVDTQIEYFECTRSRDEKLAPDEIISKKDLIFDDNIPTEQKKLLFVQLASISSVEAFRTIEKYLQKPNRALFKWAYLAFLESRLLLESTFLNENKVLITTGLGGKGHKLRYFIVFFTNDGSPISKFQQKIIENELKYAFYRNGAEIEDLIFEDGLAYFVTVVPIHIPVQQFFKDILKECNTFGSFLFNDFIISNIKKLSVEEIREILRINHIMH